MSFRVLSRLAIAAGIASMLIAGSANAKEEESPTARAASARLPNNTPFFSEQGFAATFSTRGSVDFTTPFHAPLGTNGRHCGTCHLPQSGWSIRPTDVKLLFAITNGTDPLFRPSEANRPTAPLDTVAQRRAGYSMLLNKGLFRRDFPVPANAQFAVVAVDDPYGHATTQTLSLFRRPLTMANMPLINGVAWENRTGAANSDLNTGLIRQARGNVLGAQAGTVAPPDAVLQEIVDWEMSLANAQLAVQGAGMLDKCGGRGGPQLLSQHMEDLRQIPQGERQGGRFDLFDAWLDLMPGTCTGAPADLKRARIARGQELFNTRRRVNNRGELAGTCNSCHNVVNHGAHIGGGLFNVQVSAGSRRTPDLPLYTLRRRDASGQVPAIPVEPDIQSTDPGRAMITGLWSDIDRFKVPTMRGLAARAPYFHNGSAASLQDVVRHYEETLGFSFTPDEEADLVAFLNAL